MLTLNNLKPKKGSNIQNKRIGRGQSSGQGTQAGKGHKGQKARSGGGVRFGFSGGGKPLYMRLPKVGFNNSDFQKNFAEVSLAVIDKKYVANEEVSKETLISKGILKGQRKNLPVKVLNGNLTKPLKFVKIAAFSKTALDMVSKNNGVVEK